MKIYVSTKSLHWQTTFQPNHRTISLTLFNPADVHKIGYNITEILVGLINFLFLSADES